MSSPSGPREHEPVAIPVGAPTQITTVSGWLTSEAHMTAIFLILAGVLALFGYKTTPEHLQNVWDSLTHLISTVGPIIGAVPVVFNYITSRGKLKSNAAQATAALAATTENKNLRLTTDAVSDLSRRLGQVERAVLPRIPGGQGVSSGPRESGPGIGDQPPGASQR